MRWLTPALRAVTFVSVTVEVWTVADDFLVVALDEVTFGGSVRP